MDGTLTLRGKQPMPTFTPGWNFPTFFAAFLAIVTVSGAVIAAFVTSRYSLLSKILESKDTDKRLAQDRELKAVERFDTVENTMRSMEAEFSQKFRGIESELNTSRNETLAARREIVAVQEQNARLMTENADLRAAMKDRDTEFANLRNENRRLAGECESLRRQMNLLHPESDVIG